MGIGEGCYLVLPVIGPSTVRDAVGSLVSMSGGDAWYNVTVKNDTQYFKESDYYFSKLTEGVDFKKQNHHILSGAFCFADDIGIYAHNK